MRKVLFIAGMFIACQTIGQTIPNAGFETWATTGMFFAPTSWAVSPGVFQSPQSHSVSWAIQCTVDTFTNPMTMTLDTVVGMAYSGAATVGPPVPGANLNGFAFTSKPDSITGYFKYHALGPDSVNIVVAISHWNDTTGTRVVTGHATFVTGTSDSVYQRFSVPMQYTSTATPDTCVILLLPANPQAPKHMGTSVWVDDLAFITNTTAVPQMPSAGELTVYPVPFSSELHLTGSGNTAISRLNLMNMAGQVIKTTTADALNTSDVAAGLYILQVISADGRMSNVQVMKE